MYSDVHASILEAMLNLRDAGSDVDAVTVIGRLESMGLAEEIGGIHFVMDLLESVPHAEHAITYAKKIAEMAKRREAIRIASELIDKSYDLTSDSEDVTNEAINFANELADRVSTGPKLQTEEECVYHLIDRIEAGLTLSESWFVPKIDQLTQGMAEGEMMVMAARPSHGKTMLAKQCLDEAARRGHAGLFVSEEMSKLSLANRSLQMLTVLETREWTQENAGRLRFDAQQHFAERAPVYILERCGTIDAVQVAVTKIVRNHGVKVLAVDYAQLIGGRGHNEQERIADVSYTIKGLTTKFGLRTILLAQMNRGIELRKDEPQLSDLRGSGSLEQDADIVLFPFWPWKLDNNYPHPDEYRIYQRKNRNRGIKSECSIVKFNPTRQVISAMEATDQEEVNF